MRAVLLFLAATAAACTPSVVPGSYLCGPERLCPENQACNGPDNVCVSETQVQPFACDPEGSDPAGDDTSATGVVLDALGCVSETVVATGCLTASDPADFFQFDTPANCSAVGITATVVFPVAFVPLALHFAKGSEPAMRTEVACPPSVSLGDSEDVRCLEVVLETGAHYAIGVTRDGEADADCDGACTENRYQLRLQLETP
jgi:hypothetical protein